MKGVFDEVSSEFSDHEDRTEIERRHDFQSLGSLMPPAILHKGWRINCSKKWL